MKQSRLQVTAVWAISVWPALNFMTVNWEQVANLGAAALLGIFVSTLVIGAIGHALLQIAARYGWSGFFVVVWVELICLFFGYAALRDASRWIYEVCGLPIPAFTGFIVATVLVLGVTSLLRKDEKLQFAAVTFCLIAAGVSVLMLAVTAIRFDSASNEDSVASASAGSTDDRIRGPNVYYIILDAYPGFHGLQTLTGFDNSAFMARMAARGFVDWSTERSNYLITTQELGAIFSLDYPQTDEPGHSGNPRVLYPRLLEGNVPPPLVARLQAAGYSTWHSASLWVTCPRRHFNCLGDMGFVWFDRLTQAYFASTPFGRPLLYVLGRRHDALVSIVRDLPTLAKSARPVFVFGHHLSPHPPFLLDGDCHPYSARDDRWDNWSPDSKQAFFDAIRCVNLQVEQMVDSILRVHPDALIVLQGDHGSSFTMDWQLPMSRWSASSIRERTSFLNLIRAPGECARWLDRPLGQINTARFVVACAERRPPVYLPEQTYLSTYAKGPESGVVRKWVE